MRKADAEMRNAHPAAWLKETETRLKAEATGLKGGATEPEGPAAKPRGWATGLKAGAFTIADFCGSMADGDASRVMPGR